MSLAQAKKLLACVVIDPLTGTGAPGAERKRWRDALLQVPEGHPRLPAATSDNQPPSLFGNLVCTGWEVRRGDNKAEPRAGGAAAGVPEIAGQVAKPPRTTSRDSGAQAEPRTHRSPGLRPDELDQYFFGIMDGTQPDVAEYLEEVRLARRSGGTGLSWRGDTVIRDFVGGLGLRGRHSGAGEGRRAARLARAGRGR